MELIVKSKKFGGKIVFIDDSDFEKIKDFTWGLAEGKKTFYARARVMVDRLSEIGTKHVRMHRLIMGVAEDTQIDHINHNGLDNRRENLRIANDHQQGANKRIQCGSTTGFKGVTFIKKKGLYKPRIRVNGKLIGGRSTKNIYDAAVQYNEMAIKHFGEFACINELTADQIAKATERLPTKSL